MFRLLLRALLILSLAGNGLAAPSTPAAAQLEHAVMAARDGQASSHAMPAEARPKPLGTACHAANHPSTPPAAPHGWCCDEGTHCQCGCALPMMLSRPLVLTPAAAWSAGPVAEPPLRERVVATHPPFRPPAA